MWKMAIWSAGIACFISAQARAVVPPSICVQGRLSDSIGAPLPAGSKSLTFRIFSDSLAGAKVWPQGVGESQTVTTTAEGLWVAFIGALEPLSAEVFSESARWLEIEVNGTVLPRTRLVTGPFAFRVATLDGASGGRVTSSLSVGNNSSATGSNSMVAGSANSASGSSTVALGGDGNSASADYSAVIGGLSDTAGGLRSVVIGGSGNAITPVGASSTILGGDYNRVTAENSAIVNGEANSISNVHSLIGGGQSNMISGPWSVIVGGVGNTATAQGSTIGGGYNNRARGFYSTIAGGGGLSVADSNLAAGLQAFIGGGRRNVANFDQTTVAGGDGNRALGAGAFIGGGLNNIASGMNTSVSGGAHDTANGSHSMIPGGLGNRASGAYSFAAGRRAKAQHDGAFVWGDDQDANFASTAPRQFLLRAAGGVGINTSAPEKALHVLGSAKVRDTVFAATYSSSSALELQSGGTTRMHVDGSNGNVSINGGIPPMSRLEVGGVIHSMSGGIKYPDGRTQTIGGLIAFGHVDAGGNLHANSGNLSASFDVANTRYLITISGETYATLSYATTVTADGAATPIIPAVSAVGNQLAVTLFDAAGTKVTGGFQFVTFKH